MLWSWDAFHLTLKLDQCSICSVCLHIILYICGIQDFCCYEESQSGLDGEVVHFSLLFCRANLKTLKTQREDDTKQRVWMCLGMFFKTMNPTKSSFFVKFVFAQAISIITKTTSWPEAATTTLLEIKTHNYFSNLTPNYAQKLIHIKKNRFFKATHFKVLQSEFCLYFLDHNIGN